MSLETIRLTYKVNAHEGVTVEFIEKGETKTGVIVGSAHRDYLLIEIEGRQRSLHPVFNVKYLEDGLMKKIVSKEEFESFIKAYPKELDRNVFHAHMPPLVTCNDFSDGKKWPESVVCGFHYFESLPKDRADHYGWQPNEYFIIETDEIAAINPALFEEVTK